MIHEDNTASILTGHQEIGTGTAAGLLMIAGEELDLEPSQLRFVAEDTAVTPNSFSTTTSAGICSNGPEVRAAAAAARQVLLGLASARLSVPAEGLTVSSGVVTGGGKSVTYGQLLGGKSFSTTIPHRSAWPTDGFFIQPESGPIRNRLWPFSASMRAACPRFCSATATACTSACGF